jgi:hypothetical protein
MVNEPEETPKNQIEEPLDTELPICDPHHHLWDYPKFRERSVCPSVRGCLILLPPRNKRFWESGNAWERWNGFRK